MRSFLVKIIESDGNVPAPIHNGFCASGIARAPIHVGVKGSLVSLLPSPQAVPDEPLRALA